MSDPHSEYYSLLSTCFQAPPSMDLLTVLKKHAKKPPVTPHHQHITEGWRVLEVYFDKYTDSEAHEAAAEAHYDLLGNPLGIKLEPYASYYIEGSRQGTPLVETRKFLNKWDLIPEKEHFKDFEDHAVFLLECLVQIAALTEKEGNQWEEAMEQLLQELILPWMPNFLHDLAEQDSKRERCGLYQGLSLIGCGVLALEKQVIDQ